MLELLILVFEDVVRGPANFKGGDLTWQAAIQYVFQVACLRRHLLEMDLVHAYRVSKIRNAMIESVHHKGLSDLMTLHTEGKMIGILPYRPKGLDKKAPFRLQLGKNCDDLLGSWTVLSYVDNVQVAIAQDADN